MTNVQYLEDFVINPECMVWCILGSSDLTATLVSLLFL